MPDPSKPMIIGAPAPEFSLTAGNGTEIKLSDFHAKNNVVLFFVREYN